MIKKFHDSALGEHYISNERVFSGCLLKVELDHVKLPNGSESTREYIRHPGAVCVLPFTEDGQVVFVNQLQESDSLKSFYPVIVDEIRFLKTAPICDVTEKLYTIALGFCGVLCRHNGIIFKDPSLC